MTYAPQSYKDARAFLIAEFDLHPQSRDYPADLDPAEVGIVGDAAHIRAGTSYHLGRDHLNLAKDPYSARIERDRRGLTNAAAALDIGSFTKTYPGGRIADLRHLSAWIVRQCHTGAWDAAWIREVIYTIDGATVLRYDHRRGQTSAPRAGESDRSHLWHTHLSGYRDTETVDKTSLFRRYVHELATPGAPPSAPPVPAYPGRVLTYALGRPMMRGTDVRTWQARMAARGWRIAVDGIYGPQSAAIATQFQREKHLLVDGKVGPQTWTASWTALIT